MVEKMFVYGTLRKSEVQNKVIGRTVESSPDILVGFEKTTIKIDGNIYPIIIQKENSLNEIFGEVLDIKEEDLKHLDEYETDAYRRMKVSLKSGISAWVYQK